MEKPSERGDEEEVLESKIDHAHVFDLGLEEEEEESVPLMEDTYSFMFMYDILEAPFLFGVIMFAFQIAVLAFIIPPNISAGSRNPLNVPPDIDPAVRVAQFISLFIAVLSETEVTESIKEDSIAIFHETDGKARVKYLLSCICRSLGGIGVLITTFCLIVQQETVIDIFMNFAAMMFISTIDDLAFHLASIGLFSDSLKRACIKISGTSIPIRKVKRSRIMVYFNRLFFLGILVSLIIGLVAIAGNQQSGFYLCKQIKVQFGDEINSDLGFMSGVYVQNPKRINGMVSFEESRPQGKGRFAYCGNEGYWTFSVDGPDGPDPCNWLAKSAQTSDYEISTTSPSEWQVKNSFNQAISFQTFTLFCIDCNLIEGGGACSNRGQCIDRVCECEPGRFGLSCEFTEPCGILEIDIRQDSFFSYSTMFSQPEDTPDDQIGNLKGLQSYERPVYMSKDEDNVFDILMFVGRRWIATKSTKIHDLVTHPSENITEELIVNYIVNQFHGLHSNYTIDFISDPTDALSPSDSATPIDVDWHKATISRTPDFTEALSISLLCAKCESNDSSSLVTADFTLEQSCFGKGQCVDHTCDCMYGSFGVRCQVEICRALLVIFDDIITPSLGSFTGVYAIDGEIGLVNEMPVYSNAHFKKTMFVYCSQESGSFWSFISFPPAFNVTDINATTAADKACNEWQLKSLIPGDHNIFHIKKSQWVAKGLALDVQMDKFSVECLDCDKTTNLNTDYGVCHGNGMCSDTKCICKDRYYGESCQFLESLPEVEIDESFGGFPGYSSNVFVELHDNNNKKVILYGHPVFVQKESAAVLEIMLFTGRRWILSQSNRLGMPEVLINDTDSSSSNASLSEIYNQTLVDLASYLASDFHGRWSNYDFDFISDPEIYVQTINPNPVDKNWYEAKGTSSSVVIDQAKQIDTMLVSSACNDDTFVCQNGGECMNGGCVCNVGFYGPYCEKEICPLVDVKFDSELSPESQYFSTTYEITNRTFGGRPVFRDTLVGDSFIGYCEQNNYWVFTYRRDGTGENHKPDPCLNWKARTPTSFSYEITSLTSWMVVSEETGNLVNYEGFRTTCVSCGSSLGDADSGLECGGKGTCSGNRCECDDGRYGFNCEFKAPCASLEHDPRTEQFPLGFAEEFELLTDKNGNFISSYGFPVYCHTSRTKRQIELLFFAGRRWILATDKSISDLKIKWGTNDEIVLQLAASFESFHAFWDLVDDYSFFTDPVAEGDSAPVWMNWYSNSEPITPLKTKLLCPECDLDQNVCQNNGVCFDGLCDCSTTNFSGKLCQHTLDFCGTIEVKGLQGFSGLYDIKTNGQERPIYVSRQGDGAQFEFCPWKGEWGFNGFDLKQEGNTVNNNSVDPCNTSFYVESDALELINIGSRDWKIRSDPLSSSNIEASSIGQFTVSCTSCGRAKQGAAKLEDICSNHGTCEDHACICGEGTFGPECEFDRPCSYLESSSLQGFPHSLSNKWNLLTMGDSSAIVFVYNHPVYAFEKDGLNETDLLLHTGSGWVMTNTRLLFDWNQTEPSKSSLVDYLTNSFHSYLSNYTSNLYAEDTTGMHTPIGLEWKDNNEVLSATLICGICNDIDNPCANNGVCVSDNSDLSVADSFVQVGKCSCPPGYSGSLCQSFHASCFVQPGQGIPFCRCNSQCAACGYTQYPVMNDNCISCGDGRAPLAKYPDGTGTCQFSNALTCFEEPGIGYRNGTVFVDDDDQVSVLGMCNCHESCNTCYQSSLFPDEFDRSSTCISCADGYGIHVVREVNGIKMGVCSKVCQSGLSEFC